MWRTFLTIGVFLLAFPQTHAQPFGSLEEVAEGVYAFGNSATSLVVVAKDEVVVIDPINARQSNALALALPSVTDKPVTHVIYSHNHWDHISGASVFSDKGALVISHAEAKENIKPNSQVVMPGLVWSGERFDLRLGETTIQMHHFGPSHGSGMTVFLLPEQSVLFVVDIATSGRVYPMHMPDFDIDGLVASLDAIEALDFETVVFGHGPAAGGKSLTGNKADIVETGEYLDDLIAGVRSAMKNGGFNAVTQLELPKWKHLSMYDQWLSMNATRVVISMMMGH